MGRKENIHVGYILEYQKRKAIIQVTGRNFHVSLSSEETVLLEDMLYNAQLPYIAFDIANNTIISYDAFQQVVGEKNSREVYITFINMFKI